MKEPNKEADRWLKQAESDLAYAELGLRERFFAQVCFQCQQVCEKAIKALRYGRGERAGTQATEAVEIARQVVAVVCAELQPRTAEGEA